MSIVHTFEEKVTTRIPETEAEKQTQLCESLTVCILLSYFYIDYIKSDDMGRKLFLPRLRGNKKCIQNIGLNTLVTMGN
jgi:hypothetical protein